MVGKEEPAKQLWFVTPWGLARQDLFHPATLRDGQDAGEMLLDESQRATVAGRLANMKHGRGTAEAIKVQICPLILCPSPKPPC